MSNEKEFLEKIKRLIDQNVLEIREDPSKPGDFYIPYMLSDCVEDYYRIRLKEGIDWDGRKLEEYLKGLLLKEIDPSENPTVLEEGNGVPPLAQAVAEIEEFFQLYQYHRIGHYWVKGEEYLRRLVYQLGSIYEKGTWLDDRALNAREKALFPLMEFAPLRHFSPIDEDLDDWYEESLRGVFAMQELARRAKDNRLSWLLGSYLRLPSVNLKNYLIHYLASEQGMAFVQALEMALEEASISYASRRFDAEIEQWMQAQRRRIDLSLREQGLLGRYPCYHSKDRKRQVLITEEIPFQMGLLDYEEMAHRFYQQDLYRDGAKPACHVALLAEHEI